MSEQDEPRIAQERIEREAGDWMARIDRGLSDREQEAYFDWLAADPRHGECLSESKEEWDAFDVLDQWRPVDSKLPNPDLLKQPESSAWDRRRFLWIGAAAALIALTFFGIQWREQSPGAGKRLLAQGNQAESYERHVLEDGSTVELNRGAQVSVDFTGVERRLELISGEAHFSVARSTARPFVVTARGAEVIAVGTAFNVRIESDSLEVLVTEGKVLFEPTASLISKRKSDGAIESSGSMRRAELTAGFRAVQPFNQAEFAPQVFEVTSSEVESRLAWKDAILDFDSRPLSEVVSAFNRHNHTQIVIGDETLLDMKVTVALKPNNHEGFVRLLEMTAGIDAISQDGSTVILRRKQ